MICCGVPRTLPSGPELSKTRLTIFPTERLRFGLFRERDLDDLIFLQSSLVVNASLDPNWRVLAPKSVESDMYWLGIKRDRPCRASAVLIISTKHAGPRR